MHIIKKSLTCNKYTWSLLDIEVALSNEGNCLLSNQAGCWRFNIVLISSYDFKNLNCKKPRRETHSEQIEAIRLKTFFIQFQWDIFPFSNTILNQILRIKYCQHNCLRMISNSTSRYCSDCSVYYIITAVRFKPK